MFESMNVYEISKEMLAAREKELLSKIMKGCVFKLD